ncbi:hypothetical protein PR048_020967 [Dryococelus australis]|uniref:Uncharacterized protein n=1 Tax=Dryococelus australis TaxID=614101 RepID=A0ABQ9GWX3_9NEOP|nr:hypothetical protein PR048_020967 [Dryococelus australis]
MGDPGPLHRGMVPQPCQPVVQLLGGQVRLHWPVIPHPYALSTLFEQKNPADSINTYAHEEDNTNVPILVLKEERATHFDLFLMVMEDGNTHYCYIAATFLPRMLAGKFSYKYHPCLQEGSQEPRFWPSTFDTKITMMRSVPTYLQRRIISLLCSGSRTSIMCTRYL